MVKPEDYKVIESLYMAAGDMDKIMFCKEFKAMCAYVYENGEIELRECLREIGKRLVYLEDVIRTLKRAMKFRNEEMAGFLLGKAHAYDDTDFRNEAVRFIGESAVVKKTIEMGLPLWEEDKKHIRSMLEEQCEKN